MTIPILSRVRWWWCNYCDQRAKEENVPEGHPVLTHICPAWNGGGYEIPFSQVDSADGVVSTETRAIFGNRNRVDAVQTMHKDGSFDVTVFGQVAAAGADAPPPD